MLSEHLARRIAKARRGRAGYSRELLIELGAAFIREFGRYPTNTDYASMDGFPKHGTIEKYFESYTNYWAAIAECYPELGPAPQALTRGQHRPKQGRKPDAKPRDFWSYDASWLGPEVALPVMNGRVRYLDIRRY